MRLRVPIALTTYLAALAIVAVPQADFKVESWEFLAPLTIDPAAPQAAGMVEVSLSPEILDRCRPDRGDLRVIGADSTEVAYLTECARARTESQTRSCRLYNRTFVAGVSSSVTADCEGKILKNRVRISTEGSNFRRGVLIEASDDGSTWQTVRRGAFLFRVGVAGKTEYEKDTVHFSTNNMRYMRLTIWNAPGDPEEVGITEVEILHETVDPARTSSLVIAATDVKQGEKRTILEFDLGYRHVPLKELSLAFDEPDFFRRITVSGRQAETRIVKHRVEDGRALEREIPVSWTRIQTGAIFRYSGEEGDESSLTIDLSGASYRYIRVEIHNEDNPPLTLAAASATQHLYLVRFPFQPNEIWHLYFGNPRAGAARYDLSHYAERLGSRGLVTASPGVPISNPAFGEVEAPKPWSERHRVILWVGLLAGVLVLGALIVLQMRAHGRSRIE